MINSADMNGKLAIDASGLNNLKKLQKKIRQKPSKVLPNSSKPFL
jgi:hypothetical protein